MVSYYTDERWCIYLKKIDVASLFSKEKLKSERFYYRDELLSILYSNLSPVYLCDYIEAHKEHKYIKLAIERKFTHYRMCSVSELLELGLMKSFSYFAKDFINKNGEFLIIFNLVDGNPAGMVMRSLKEKEFIDMSLTPIPYGLDMMQSDFKYGDFVLLTEGPFDADSIRFVFKNTLASLTANITVKQAQILTTLTNKFVIAYDTDKAGNSGFQSSIDRLLQFNPDIIVHRLPIYRGDKDLGEVEESRQKNDMSEYNSKVSHYKRFLKVYHGGVLNEESIEINPKEGKARGNKKRISFEDEDE